MVRSSSRAALSLLVALVYLGSASGLEIPVCRYIFCSGKVHFKIGESTDKSFTGAICDRERNKIGTVDESAPAFRIHGGRLHRLATWPRDGSQEFTPSFFKSFPVKGGKHAGVGHETMQKGQAEFFWKRKCWILPFRAFQILDNKGNAMEKHTDEIEDCVKFCTTI